ncbi:NADH:flavin oxidoreductase/NADH oxidase [Pokkaliibacter sp. CJK22405]|uniref:NADH:flavin oxidoreductase/NADH oxidase n=1 Tax=Pokkaliibacter sp. CJK22405 TaxID=3384615 RepID=UPI0039849662
MSALFTPYTLKSVTLRNRLAVPPMCQYSAENGYISDWHEAHYAGMARGGASLVIVEATAVSPEGRITHACTGLWEDGQIDGMARIARAIKQAGSVPGIQIGHAGIKASANRPWEGDNHIPNDDPRGWQTIAPSAVSFGTDILPKVPTAMSKDDIARVRDDFVSAAQRALAAGYEWLELHFAHGYLAQSFFSVNTNQRTDEYGGSAENRGRFLRETLAAVREVWPEHLPLTLRFGVLEFDGRDEETLAESIALIREFKAIGLDFISVSMGFCNPKAQIPWSNAFMAPIAARVREETGLPVATAWGMDVPADGERAITEAQMDLVLIGKGHLANPHVVYQMARDLGVDNAAAILPEQYTYWLERYAGPRVTSAE